MDSGSEPGGRTGGTLEGMDPWRNDAMAAAGGDRPAFERLYRAHMQRVFSVCMRMVSDRNKAEELTQDVFVRVWQKLPTFRGDAQVSTWLHRVTVNVVLTHRKSDGAGKNRAVNDDEAIALTPARAAFVGERLDLDGAIATLPRGARQVFVLHDVEGFTHEEIGEQLGISPGGSKAQLHRARMLLRQALSR
jgi:RNA polymerase sigma-70 factor (ECF subfamily)